METQAKRLRKYSGISLAAVLAIGFVLVQPTMNQAYAVGIEGGLPAYDGCSVFDPPNEDPTSMNTVRNKDIVKTIHAEKVLFGCSLTQGDLVVLVDVTTYLEVYENITSKEVLATNAFSTTCILEPNRDEFKGGATLIDCESKAVPSSPVFVNNCREQGGITHPQEMNTVTKGKIAKTVEAQKEIFECSLPDSTFKTVHIVLFTEIYEDLTTHEITSIQFLSARCVVLGSDRCDLQDADVESCIFSEIEN